MDSSFSGCSGHCSRTWLEDVQQPPPFVSLQAATDRTNHVTTWSGGSCDETWDWRNTMGEKRQERQKKTFPTYSSNMSARGQPGRHFRFLVLSTSTWLGRRRLWRRTTTTTRGERERDLLTLFSSITSHEVTPPPPFFIAPLIHYLPCLLLIWI